MNEKSHLPSAKHIFTAFQLVLSIAEAFRPFVFMNLHSGNSPTELCPSHVRGQPLHSGIQDSQRLFTLSCIASTRAVFFLLSYKCSLHLLYNQQQLTRKDLGSWYLLGVFRRRDFLQWQAASCSQYSALFITASSCSMLLLQLKDMVYGFSGPAPWTLVSSVLLCCTAVHILSSVKQTNKKED